MQFRIISYRKGIVGGSVYLPSVLRCRVDPAIKPAIGPQGKHGIPALPSRRDIFCIDLSYPVKMFFVIIFPGDDLGMRRFVAFKHHTKTVRDDIQENIRPELVFQTVGKIQFICERWLQEWKCLKQDLPGFRLDRLFQCNHVFYHSD